MNNIEKIKRELSGQAFDAMMVTAPVNTRYLTGFAASAAVLLVTADDSWFFTDSRYIEAAKAAVKETHVLLTTNDKPYADLINPILKEHSISSLGFEDGTMTYSAYLDWKKKLKTKLVPAQKLIADLRMIKSLSDLDKIKKAQRIAEKSFEEIIPLISTDITEKQLVAELINRFLRNGADDKAFDPIVVSGQKSSMPHGVPGDVKITAGFLTIDFGVMFEGWRSDTTRTLCVGKPDDEMKKIYDIVLRAQEAGISAAQGGVKGKYVDAAARSVIVNAGYGDYFGHGLGHGVGLEIHELPRASPIYDDDIPTGSVITVEPGIYLPGRYGVRIEDVIYVKEDGVENITNLTKEFIII